MEGKGKLPPLRTGPATLTDYPDKKSETQSDHKTDPATKSIESPSRETGLRSDNNYGSYPEDTSLQKREVTAETVAPKPEVHVGNAYLTDQKQFDDTLSAVSKTLIKCPTRYSLSKLPYWISSNQYPIRQFRAYYLLELDKQNPASHEKLETVMSQLEQKFMQHREDLISKRIARPVVIASDLFNSLAAIQVFLGKTAEAKKTIQQGFGFEPDSIVFSLQYAQFDLRINDEQVLQGFSRSHPIDDDLQTGRSSSE
ncbi:hypothetical protein [Endozoicomonas sp. 4G]|uniref:hypothetical protein n=1 Tax=Endozoicomonas sp. 4G TaxID=2872754 RepID=UPI0020788AD5|nr:hypothetical protein [Endozoicomonas sp. 4G]